MRLCKHGKSAPLLLLQTYSENIRANLAYTIVSSNYLPVASYQHAIIMIIVFISFVI